MRNLKKVLSLALALVMLLGMMVVGAGAATSFKDDSSIPENRAVAVAVANKIEVLLGDENGNFNPDNTLTRAEAAVVLAKLDLGADAANALVATNAATFNDVGTGYGWAKAYIDYCAGNGYMVGVGGNSFAPGRTLTSVEFATMVSRVLGYKDENEYGKDGWTVVKAAALARKAGLGTDVVIANADMTRADMAQMVLNALTAPMVEYTGLNGSIGDATFSSPATTRKHANDVGTGGDYKNDPIQPNITPIRLCEEKFPNLKLRNTANDDTFGRSYSVWTWKSVEIAGTEANTQADAVFTAKTNEAGVKAAINDARTSGSGAYKYVNGQVSVATANAKTISDLTGNGRLVEVYLAQNNKTLITKIVVVDTVLGEVTRINDSKEEISIKLERSDNAVTGSPVLTTKVGHGSFKRGDMVLVQGWYNDTTLSSTAPGYVTALANAEKLNSKTTITSVEEAPKVEGLARQKNYSNKTITVDGEVRGMSFSEVKDYGFDDFAVSNTYDCTLYLDNYNNIVKAIKGEKSNVVDDNLIAVSDAYTSLENGRIVYKVSGVLSSGEKTTLTVTDDMSGLKGSICTYTDNRNGTYNVASINATNADDSKLYVSNNTTQTFNSNDAYGQGNGTNYMYADDVKFIFVENDGNTTVLNGRQSQTVANGTVVAQALRDVKRDGVHSRYEIVAVFIADEPNVVDISDIIFVYKGSTETAQVTDDVVDDANGNRRTIYGYVAYNSEGEQIDPFYGKSQNMGHHFYKRSTETIGDNTVYGNTAPTSIRNHTVESATVVFQNGLRGDAFVLNVNGTDVNFIGGGAKVVDLCESWIEDIADLNEEANTKNVVVSVIYNGTTSVNTNRALTIFVESVTDKPASGGLTWDATETEKTITTVNRGDATITVPDNKTLTVENDMLGTIVLGNNSKLIVEGNLGGTVTVNAEEKAEIIVDGNLTEIANITVSPETVVKVSGEQKAAVKVAKPTTYTGTGEWNIFKDDKGLGVRVLNSTWSSWAGNSICKYSWGPILVRWSELPYADAVATYKHTESGTTYKHVIVSIQDTNGDIIYQELAGTGLTVIDTNPTNTAQFYFKDSAKATTLAAGTTIRVTAYVLRTPVDENATPVSTAVDITNSTVVGEKLVDFTCKTPSAS